LRRILTGLALITSLLAFLAIAGTGLFLAGVEQSGERGLGVLLAAAGTVAFSAVLFLLFAPAAYFRRRATRILAGLAALIGILPVAAISAATLSFVGVPYGSALPRLDLPLFAVGVLFGLGAVAIAALGFVRTASGGNRRRWAQPRGDNASAAESLDTALYTPLVAESARKVVDNDRRSIEIEDDIRVRRA
jgi:hypothetical protein